jgi:hypothetical protein
MAIVLNIVDDSGLASPVGALWITGHGIPGSGGATTLMALGASGTFAQAATQISSVSWAGNVATISTAVAHNLAVGDSVFVAGVTPNGYNGLFAVASIPSTTTFTYSLTQTSLASGSSGGTAYGAAAITAAVAIQGGQSVGFDTDSNSGIAQITTTSAHGLQIGQTIQISGAEVAGYDGVLVVAQVPSATTFQYAYSATSALGNASAGGQVQAVGLQPVLVSALPTDSNGTPQITLDENINAYSAKLIVLAVPGTQPPASLSFNGNAVTPTDPPTPPFSPSTLAGNFMFDIVEFAYIAGGNSTFDVSAVDGLAIPMTLTASTVTSGPSSVGVRPSCDRPSIAAAFAKFTSEDPLGGDFGKLYYNGQVTLPPLTIDTAAWSNNAATITTTTAHGLGVADWVVIAGVSQSGYDGNFQVQSVPSTTSFTVTNTDSSLTSSTGGTATALLFAAPPSVGQQYFNIAAPKDWLANQSASMAANDALATFWDDAVNAFFASGNNLSINVGTTYSGSSDGTQYSLSNGTNTYTFAAPTGGSLANALYVWAQANAPSGDQGQLQDQIWQALCRGVAQSGVFAQTAPANGSTTAWNQNSAWYQSGTYCPYSKFLHYGKPDGGTDPTGATSIFLEAAAYGFGEDENPSGDYTGPLVPSKLDGTIADGTTLTIRIAPWNPAPR